MADALTLTHGVRARPVAIRPPRSTARRLRAGRVARGCTAVVIVAALSLLVVIAARTWLSQRPASHRAEPPVPSLVPPTETALLTLARTREIAFAERNTALLAKVYLPGPLLEADAALLARIVPAGCGLVGAHTAYRDIVVSGTQDHPVITTTATLSSSRLVCAGSQTGTARGIGPTGLRIELVRTAAGYRIAAQRAG
jgi:hypothetical protein